MDLHEDEGLQCSSSLHCESPKRTVVDAGVQLDLNNDLKSDSEDFESAFENNFTNLNMKLPITVQNCIPPPLQVSSELVVITNTGNVTINAMCNKEKNCRTYCPCQGDISPKMVVNC